MAEPASDRSGEPPSICAKCKSNPATLTIRAKPTCSPCFQTSTLTKVVKRLGSLRKSLLKPTEKRTCRYLAALSFGPSSSTLIRLLHENLEYMRAKANANSPVAYDLTVLHVDTDLRSKAPGESSAAEDLLEKYRANFPGIEFRCVPLSDALKLRSIDWNALPSVVASGDPPERMRAIFDALPSVTSRTDLLRLLVRHVLLAQAVENGCDALFLGCTTTALAELTLSEVAKGRGFSIPWQINDGPFPLPKGLVSSAPDSESKGAGPPTIHIYYPLREILRAEIHTYLSLCDPPLTDLVHTENTSGSANVVVSHKDLSIEEAMVQYFKSVEESYPAIVANVVRTTAKLERADVGEGAACSVCGMAVDESGDARWKGEIGMDVNRDGEGGEALPLCYGCERSIHG
ncbi:related to Cytoplasmic tRNA 2-thiolation protein 2 [Cephalotrichum gorgonifer]|uniref:Cytoplasmic tRNA 2-thiolation protein 2 n=1 Tax=Cephalotrichum gorgonifer TaxID=2041049 RepID=A0AAE8STI8_9PEZI|nr:related to Cytoplasmic tRNA 2-thiolation protein 2 [Cephalotrichum gorgonifer]